MNAYQYTVTGLDNLRRLRDRFLGPLHTSLLPKKLMIVDDEVPLYDQQTLPDDEVEFSKGLLRWFVSHGLAGVVGVSLVYVSFGHQVQGIVDSLLLWAAGRSGISLIMVAIGAGLVAFLLILAVGEAVHYVLIYASRLPIAVLDLIDANTPNGTIGILGFMFLLLGFLLQVAGALVGHKTP
jgi:hypothetical protein